MASNQRRPGRVETSEPAEPLTPRFERFLLDDLKCVSLDQSGDSEMRPDFSCLGGLLAIEIKSLKTSPADRLERTISDERSGQAWPRFVGRWPIESVLRNHPRAQEINRKLLGKLGKTISQTLKKANDQLAHYEARSQRRNLVRLVVLLNEDFAEYTPDAVVYIVRKALSEETDKGTPRCNEIDAVVYLSERHVLVLDDQPAYFIGLIEGPTLDSAPWKSEVIQKVMARWIAWNKRPQLNCSDLSPEDLAATTITLERIPEKLRRHEAWSLAYRRHPYMRKWENDALLDFWDATMIVATLATHKASPVKVTQEKFTEALERFAHIQEENAYRGLPLDFYKPDRSRILNLIKRSKLPAPVAEWFNKVLRPTDARSGDG